ncbi:MAG: hypothetical protein AAGJ52_10330 [Pseudomonadota bacterium]
MKNLNLNTVLPTAALAFGSSLSFADTELPDARSLVDGYVEAVGGMDAMMQSMDATMRGRFVMPAAGMEGEMVLYSRTPTERFMEIELPGLGSIRSGYKDGMAWSVDPFMGPRLITSAELDMQIEANEPGALARSEEYVESMQTVGTAEYNGESCYKVDVVWKSGRETSDCYAVDTGLLLASEATVESPMGMMETTTVFAEYKTFESNGVELKLPSTTNVTTMGQQQQLIVDALEIGEPAGDNFELPAAIVTLMDDDAAGETATD